jgi:hypothetical protein
MAAARAFAKACRKTSQNYQYELNRKIETRNPEQIANSCFYICTLINSFPAVRREKPEPPPIAAWTGAAAGGRKKKPFFDAGV